MAGPYVIASGGPEMNRAAAVGAVALMAIGVGGLLGPLPAPAAGSRPTTGSSPALRTDHHGVSLNWSGYEASGGGPYTSVSASWTQPEVDCAKTPTAYSSFWVGLDGWKTPSVEQTGTEAGCFEGTPVYFAWSEMYPKAAKQLPRKDVVSPGDSFTSTVTYVGKNKFRLTLSDATRGWSHTVTQASRSAERGSAEVIAEAPSAGSEVLPLADFGVVSFTDATIDGAPLSGSTPNLEPLTMTSKGNVAEAEPSALSGGSFSDTWLSE
jgi:Peptidase A4 family